MKYVGAGKVLPKELVRQIQEYVQGEYIYIPVRDKGMNCSVTDYRTELQKRDAHIYTKYLEGLGRKQLAELYSLSGSSIRRIIIKQRKGYTEMQDKITKILSHWGLQNSRIRQIYDTTWQVGDRYIMKVYRDVNMLERNCEILQVLDEMGLPVGKVELTRDGDWYALESCGSQPAHQPAEKYSCAERRTVSDGSSEGCGSQPALGFLLSQKLPGSSLIEINDIRELALAMGEVIANLHVAFRRCEDKIEFWDNSLLDEMNGWVRENFERTDWKYISQEEYEEIISHLSELYYDLPVQLIHRDVHFGNFLFSKGKFSGYIDFDLSQRNIRIFDLCYFLLGLLSEEENLRMTEREWFEFLEYVFQGYEKILQLSGAERKAVPYVMECIELLFVSWFDGEEDLLCAKDAYQIFEFVKKSEEQIWNCIEK